MRLLLADGDTRRLQKLAALAGREEDVQLVGVARDLVEALDGVRPPVGARWGTRAWSPRPSGGSGRRGGPAVDVMFAEAELPGWGSSASAPDLHATEFLRETSSEAHGFFGCLLG